MGKPKKSERAQIGPGGTSSPRPTPPLPQRALHLVPESILSLETTAPQRPTITIDGIAYRISFYEDFALWQTLKLQKLAAQANDFDDLAIQDEAAEVTPEQWAELEVAQTGIYGEMVAIVLPDLPEPTLLALSLTQRRAIVQAFFAATGAAVTTPDESQTAPMAAEAAAPPTGSPS
jgi:hypothetical protein